MDNSNGIVVGKGANVFTVADEIQIRMVPAINGAVAQIPSRKTFCLKPTQNTDGAIIANTEACNDMQGITGETPEYWTRSDGVKFYVVGKGDFLMDSAATNISPNLKCDPAPNGSAYKVCRIGDNKSQYEFTLFKGSGKYGNLSNPGVAQPKPLYEQFVGGTQSKEALITLHGCALYNA